MLPHPVFQDIIIYWYKLARGGRNNQQYMLASTGKLSIQNQKSYNGYFRQLC